MLVAYGGLVALAHSNLPLSFGPLGRIVVSPNFHRIHHRMEGRQDVNLGFALTIWDQMFKTAIMPTKETVAIATGLAGRPLVVEQQGERAHHFATFVKQMVAPIPSERRFVCFNGQRGRASEWSQMSETMVTRFKAAQRRVASPEVQQTSRDVALAVARIALAWIFIYHGAVTLFGAFHGAGLHATATFFATVAHLHPGLFFATLSGIIEFFGGIALALGVFGRLAALGLVGDMVIAMITVTFKNG